MKGILLFIIAVLASNLIEANSVSCPTITAINVTQPLCFGQSNGAISIDYSVGTPPYSIFWSSPISQTTTSTALTQSLTGVPSGAYTFTLTDNGGCNISQPVSVSQPPFLVLNTSPAQTICYGQSTQIYASGSGGTAPYTYSWSPNIGSGSGPHFVNPTTSAQYNVLLSDNNGCSPSPKVITVNVTPPLAIIANSYTVCEGDNIVLSPTITIPGNGGPYDFIWSNGVIQNGVTSSSISVISSTPTPNTYTVNIDDNCTVPSASAVFTLNVQPCTGLTELTNEIYFSIYPNPARDLLYIESNQLNKNLNIEIYNSIGEKVKSDFLYNSIRYINLNVLSEGIYLLQIKRDSQIIYKTNIVKQE